MYYYYYYYLLNGWFLLDKGFLSLRKISTCSWPWIARASKIFSLFAYYIITYWRTHPASLLIKWTGPVPSIKHTLASTARKPGGPSRCMLEKRKPLGFCFFWVNTPNKQPADKTISIFQTTYQRRIFLNKWEISIFFFVVVVQEPSATDLLACYKFICDCPCHTNYKYQELWVTLWVATYLVTRTYRIIIFTFKTHKYPLSTNWFLTSSFKSTFKLTPNVKKKKKTINTLL